ncbi:MAG TPA: 23S rRNA (adenine(2030)-N(6))-methyltransferase RlmJ [Gammaproteobacteria bacterium]|nr:23S rRNA (adenine(2030)-N(6))-methyltransferase RlmJ [Gammaproteobacteria bacterium]
MNYRHAYHAGNFADVMKHVLLMALIEAMQKKDKPFCVLDTHAGAGIYDLLGEQAKKSGEADAGILRLLSASEPPALVKRYLDLIKTLNPHHDTIKLYPGSPKIAADCLRSDDRLIVCELQRDPYASLRDIFHSDKRVAVHHTDGYLGLKAFLPPQEKRGLILIDPPYEASDEFQRIARDVRPALERFATGVYAIWYPIKDKHPIDRLYRSLKQATDNSILTVELSIYPELGDRLTGTGLCIINPPFQFESTIKPVLAWLWKVLSVDGSGAYRAQFQK